MAGEHEAAPAALRRPFDYVHARAVIADEVEVSSSETANFAAKIPCQIERFEKNLWHHHRRAQIDYYSARETGSDRYHPMKVRHRGRSDGSTVGGRMHMDNIGAEGNVDCRRNSGLVSTGEDTVRRELFRRPRMVAPPAPLQLIGKLATDHLAEPTSLIRCKLGGLVEEG